MFHVQETSNSQTPVEAVAHKARVSNCVLARVTTLQTEKNYRPFTDLSRRNCRQCVEHLFIQIIREHHVWKINYSTNKEQISYMMIWEHVQNTAVHATVWLPAFCWDATIKFPWQHKFSDFSPTLGLFPDFPLTLVEFADNFPVSRNSRKVVSQLVAWE